MSRAQRQCIETARLTGLFLANGLAPDQRSNVNPATEESLDLCFLGAVVLTWNLDLLLADLRHCLRREYCWNRFCDTIVSYEDACHGCLQLFCEFSCYRWCAGALTGFSNSEKHQHPVRNQREIKALRSR